MKITLDIGGQMYTFFYPENNRTFFEPGTMEFETAQEAIDFWKERRPTWDEIPKQKNEAAFLSPRGEIVVIRRL